LDVKIYLLVKISNWMLRFIFGVWMLRFVFGFCRWCGSYLII